MSDDTKIWAMLETPDAVENAVSMAGNIACIVGRIDTRPIQRSSAGNVTRA